MLASNYRQNAATTHGFDVIDEFADTFVQYQADNVDHVSRTLDGSGTIHVMGQMGTFTPALKVTRRVSRLKVNMDNIFKCLPCLPCQTSPTKKPQDSLRELNLVSSIVMIRIVSWTCSGVCHYISQTSAVVI